MRKAKLIFAYIMLVVLVGSGTFFFVHFSKADKSAKIVTTIFPIYDMCREILGTDDSLLMLQDNGMDMHSYQPTASDIKSISQAELFIHVGGESDTWVGDIIRSADNVNLKVLSLMNVVQKLNETNDGILQGGEHEHEHGDEEHGHEHGDEEHGHEETFDEHIWLSLKNMQAMTEGIAEKLLTVYPERTEIIKENTSKLMSELKELDNEYMKYCLNKEKTMVVADRFPFLYLAKDYNIKYLAAFSGCSADVEASAGTISKLIDKVNSEDLNYICVLETSDLSIANKVVEDSNTKDGVEIVTLNSCQAVSIIDIDSISYIDIMRENLENLKKVLNS